MNQKILIASDHAGLSLKKYLVQRFHEFNWEDLGPQTEDAVDYPDYAIKLCKKLDDNIGILICGTGQGMAMTANKFPNIRAALCWNQVSAEMARKHNNANILCLGARMIDPPTAETILTCFLQTKFEGGRHQKRIDKITI